jgi:hypothetical protein
MDRYSHSDNRHVDLPGHGMDRVKLAVLDSSYMHKTRKGGLLR